MDDFLFIEMYTVLSLIFIGVTRTTRPEFTASLTNIKKKLLQQRKLLNLTKTPETFMIPQQVYSQYHIIVHIWCQFL